MKDKPDSPAPVPDFDVDADPDDAPVPIRPGRPRRFEAHGKDEKLAPPTRKMKQEYGSGLRVLRHAIGEHPGDPFAQLVMFFEGFRLPAATGRKRQVSIKTEEKYFNLLKLTLQTMRRPLNMPIRNLSELSTKHVRAVTRHMEGHCSASHLSTLNTVQRRFGIWIGKPDLAPPLPELVANPESAKRRSSLTTPKTWESRDVDPLEVIAAAHAECPVTAVQMQLGWAFGLRVEEQLMICPAESLIGDVLLITRGTKGGRPRKVKLKAAWEYALVEQAKAMAEAHPKKILQPRPYRQLEQARSHYYYVCRKIGLSTSGRFRSTPHGARHSFAARGYQVRTGLPAPVLGGAKPPSEIDRAARQALAEELGHSRLAITAAYLGTATGMRLASYRHQERLAERDELLGEDAELLELAAQARITTFCLVGDAASGEKLQGPALLFCEGPDPIPEQTIGAILARVGHLLSARCVLVDRRALELPTFEVLSIERAGSVGLVNPLQCSLDFGMSNRGDDHEDGHH